MKRIVSELLQYVENDQTGALLEGIELELGKSDLRVVAIKLLGWIKVQARQKKPQPLELCPAFPWCERLRNVVQKNEHFSEVFNVEGNILDFRVEVSQKERAQILELVNEKFNPPLFR